MSDRYIEKRFVYLLVLSLVLHLAVLAAVLYLPVPAPPPPSEPVFVDLQQVPEFKTEQQQQPQQRQVPRLSDRRVRVERETAPRARDTVDRGLVPPAPRPAPGPTAPPQRREGPRETTPGRPSPPLPQVSPGSSVSSLLKPKGQATQQPNKPRLFPGASGLAKLEENYRRKFENEIAEGDTKFLNSDDIQFGSFLRRFENSVYGVWRYPSEAARNGVEGITPVKVTFNRKGEILHVQLLESSGSQILDEEVFRTLRAIGPVGGFPKGYDKDVFHLIAFFQYGMSRRSLR